jgi:hypothetical protein
LNCIGSLRFILSGVALLDSLSSGLFFDVVGRAVFAVAVVFVLFFLGLGFFDLEVLIVLYVLVEILRRLLVREAGLGVIDVSVEHLLVVFGLGVFLDEVLHARVLDSVKVSAKVLRVLRHAIGGLLFGTLGHYTPDAFH